MANWGVFEGRTTLAGVDVGALGARRFVNLIHGVMAEGLNVEELRQLDKWLDPPEAKTPEQVQEELRPTWGMTPDAVAGQDAMIAMLK